jgi:hypothetical protein
MKLKSKSPRSLDGGLVVWRLNFNRSSLSSHWHHSRFLTDSEEVFCFISPFEHSLTHSHPPFGCRGNDAVTDAKMRAIAANLAINLGFGSNLTDVAQTSRVHQVSPFGRTSDLLAARPFANNSQPSSIMAASQMGKTRFQKLGLRL